MVLDTGYRKGHVDRVLEKSQSVNGALQRLAARETNLQNVDEKKKYGPSSDTVIPPKEEKFDKAKAEMLGSLSDAESTKPGPPVYLAYLWPQE